MCHRSVLCLPVVPHQLFTTTILFTIGRLVVPTCAFNSAVYCVFSTTIGQLLAGQCSVQYNIKMWSRLNCWLVRVSPTQMSQLMADRWSVVRYVPVASVQLLMCRSTPWSTGTCCLHSAASARRCGGCYGNVRVWPARKIHYHSPPHTTLTT